MAVEVRGAVMYQFNEVRLASDGYVLVVTYGNKGVDKIEIFVEALSLNLELA
jgi:hypothetical protein